jgi:hypothetical protein
VVSNFTGKWLTPDEATDPGTESPPSQYGSVQRRRAPAAAKQDRVFVEVGPGTSMLRASVAAERPYNGLSGRCVIEDPATDEVYFRAVAGRLWAKRTDRAGAAVVGGNTTHPAAHMFQHSRF